MAHTSLKNRGMYTSDLNEAAKLVCFLSCKEDMDRAKISVVLDLIDYSKKQISKSKVQQDLLRYWFNGVMTGIAATALSSIFDIG